MLRLMVPSMPGKYVHFPDILPSILSFHRYLVIFTRFTANASKLDILDFPKASYNDQSRDI